MRGNMGVDTAVTQFLIPFLGLLAGASAGPEAVAPRRCWPTTYAVDGARAHIRLHGVSLAIEASIPGSTLLAEGILWDSARSRYLVSGIQGIFSMEPGGRVARLSLAQLNGRAVLGLSLDPGRDKVWAIASATPQTPNVLRDKIGQSAVISMSRKGGRLLAEYALPGTDQWYGDLAVAANGSVYVGNPRTGRLYVIRPGAKRAELMIVSGLVQSPQGMFAHPDGKRLFIADYRSGLMVLDLKRSTASAIPAPPDAKLQGIDGIVAAGRDIIALQNGLSPFRILRLRMNPSYSRIEAVSVLAEFESREGLDVIEPTLGTLAGGDVVFVARTPWDKWSSPEPNRLQTLVARLCLAK
ncbi:MAG: hypothetical protein H0W74_13040 [Sphingosinicella sp.]|nr:hypothetical protein [Sphingosinicella sp.]